MSKVQVHQDQELPFSVMEGDYPVARFLTRKKASEYIEELGHEWLYVLPEEKKPWHDAKDAEHWLIYFSDFPDKHVSALVQGGKFIYNDPCCGGFAEVDDPEIVRAERKWPEEEK